MSDRTFGRKKAGTSTFSNPSLVSPTTPTLANPVRGFGLPTNNVIQTAIKESTNLQEVQPAGEQSLLSQAIQQRSFGHDISRIPLRRPQAKLTVGAPNDVYEQEADRIADQVMSMPDAKPSVQHEAMLEEEDEIQTKPLAATITPLVQRETMPEEEEIQTKRSPDAGFQAGSNLESQLNSSQGRGSPLPDEVRTFMEPRFGADFSQVRVHTGNESVQMNQDLNAQAFTHKQDIYFGARKAPAKDVLTAHELTHVVQQTGAVQTKEVPNKPNVQLKCSACDEEEQVQRSVEISSVSEMQVRRSWFGDDDEEKEPENSSGGGVLDWAKEKASGAVDSVSQAGGDAYDWAKDKGSAAVDTVTQAGGDAYNWAKDKGEQYSSELLEGKKASLLAQIGQAMQKVARQDIVYLSSDQIAALNGHLGTLSQETQGSISLPEIAAQTDSTDSTAPPGTEPIAASTVVTLLQNLQASLSTPFMSPPVSDMSDSDDSETVQSKIQRAAIAIPIVVAGGAAVSIWTILNVIGIMLFIVGIILLMSKGGKKNTADTGIMDEVRRLIEAAKKTGKLLSICEALEIIRKAAEQAGDIKKLLKLKATEKFYGCRGSSYSGR